MIRSHGWISVTEGEMNSIDMNARAYGWEVGRGAKLGERIENPSDDNPFLNPNWRDAFVDPYETGELDEMGG